MERRPKSAKGVRPVQGYAVDLTVISEVEAQEYLALCRDRNHPRRVQRWFDHCVRIRRELRTLATPGDDREELRA